MREFSRQEAVLILYFTGTGNSFFAAQRLAEALDDTLYSEKQYVRSGYKAVAKLLGDEALADSLWTYFENGKPAIDELLNELGCMGRKEECLMYLLRNSAGKICKICPYPLRPGTSAGRAGGLGPMRKK